MKTRVYMDRVRATQTEMGRRAVDAMVVIKPEHVRYLSGVWGYSTRPEYASPRRLLAVVVPRRGDVTLIVPKLELNFAKRKTWIPDVRHHVEWASQLDEVFGGTTLLRHVLQEKGLTSGRVGLELGFISVNLYAILRSEFPGLEFEDSSSILEQQRMIKSPEEIEVMRIGGRMAVAELDAEVAALRAGIREYEVALRGRDEATHLAAEYIIQHEAGGPLQHPVNDALQIVTSADRLDMPHALASTRRINAGEIVLLDFCRVPQLEYYRIGFSRNAALRELTAEDRELCRLVGEAYDLAVDALKPGTPAEIPDLIARKFLDDHGIGETFIHRTGRGVGLEGVEKPEIGAGDKTLLAPGMVVTIEPSIYHQNFAVHPEDTYLITKNGCECLTACSRDFRII